MHSEKIQQDFEGSHRNPPVSPVFASRVRVIVHPSLFWSVFYATNLSCTEFAVALFSNAT